jgi:hypothetical protein
VKHSIKVNDFVQSEYRAPWKGLVLSTIARPSSSNMTLILIVRDSKNNRPRKRILKYLDSAWVKHIKPFDISNIPKEWFVIPIG